jgi:hypothetical protein
MHRSGWWRWQSDDAAGTARHVSALCLSRQRDRTESLSIDKRLVPSGKLRVFARRMQNVNVTGTGANSFTFWSEPTLSLVTSCSDELLSFLFAKQSFQVRHGQVLLSRLWNMPFTFPRWGKEEGVRNGTKIMSVTAPVGASTGNLRW